MYSRLKSSLLNHFQKGANSSSNPSYNGLTKEEKKRLRHSLAECQLNDVYDPDSAHSSYQHSVSFVTTKPSSRHHQQTIDTSGHAPLAPQEVYLDETSSNSASTFYSDLLASSFSSAGGNSSFTCDYEDTNETSFIMSSGLPALSWNVQTVLMSHSLRRVTDISARPDTQNIGYVATEPVGRTYRRLCHVFHCQSLKEAEEIENVLRNANQSQVLAAKQPKSAVSTSSMHPTNTASTMTEKRSASTVFLNRFLGKKGSQTVDESGQCKRKRRPVSAVFSSAIHRLSSSTSSVNPKRMSTIEPQAPTREQLLQLQNQMRCAASSPVPEEPRPTDLCAASTTTSTSSVASSSSSNGSSSSTDTSPVPPAPQTALVYDEKLGEWIYPIDQALMTQLDNCSYFVGQPTKDSMVYNLNTQPEGAFVIRYSESKSKCLALSMRVPCSHNPSGISHYLIIRNEQGFRLKLSATKKPFPTLQMMLTHHSVLESHLPCTLHFVQWQKTNFKQLAAMSTVERPLRTFNRHSTALTKIDENRNVTATSTPYRPSGRCGGGIDDFTTPKNRRTRNEINAMRRSHFFDDRQIVL